MNNSDVAFVTWLEQEIQSDNPHDILYVETLQSVLNKFRELKQNEPSVMDFANVLGSFMNSELDWIENNDKETKKLKHVLDLLKEQDLYYQEADYNWDEELELSYYTFDVEGFIEEHMKDTLEGDSNDESGS